LKILIVQTAFIGDVILITPLIRAIKKHFSAALLDIIVVPQTADLLQNNPHINSTIIFDKKKNKLLSFFSILKTLRSEKYDIAFLTHSSSTSALLTLLAGIPVRVGFDRWLSRKFLTKRVKHIPNVFKIEKYLNLLSPYTSEKSSIQTELFPTVELIDKAKQITSNLKSKTKKLIAVAPGSVWFTKRWPEEYFAELVTKLTKDNFGIIFIGSKEESDICERIQPESNSINLAGELSLLESAAIVNECDLMICNDSGAMHIANAMKTDVLAFFGPTVKKIGYFPFRTSDIVLERNLDCRPCGSHGADKCPLGHFECMKLIKPDYVSKVIQNKFTEN